jgi:hypothetical protein
MYIAIARGEAPDQSASAGFKLAKAALKLVAMAPHFTCRSDWAWAFETALGPTAVHARTASALPSQQRSLPSACALPRRPSLLRVEDSTSGVAAWGTSTTFDRLNNKAGLCQELAAAGADAWAAPPTVCVAWDADEQQMAALAAVLPAGDGRPDDAWLLLKPARACHGDGIEFSDSVAELVAVAQAEAATARAGGEPPLAANLNGCFSVTSADRC